MGGPLQGTRVLEMANFISGPYAAMLLADLGAEVIKVEVPGQGDPFRGWTEGDNPRRPQFAAYNRGKKSVTINVQHDEGRELYLQLAREVDVVVENFRPGTADRLGIGYEALRESNPGLVYCAITGMGSTGPNHRRPTYDAIGQALSGLWSVVTDLSDPRPVGPPLSDQLTGVYAAYGVLAALAARAGDQAGQGQRIEVSMLSAGIAFMTEPVASYLEEGEISDQDARPRRSQSYAFVAGDALPFAIHLSSPPKFWEGLVAAVERPELLDDPRFKTRTARIEHYTELHDLLAELFRSRPRLEWLTRLEERDVPVAPINDIAEAVDDEQARHLGVVQTFGEGERAVDLVGYPVAFADTPCTPELPPPDLGEHNAAVFGALGYDAEPLARLAEAGTV